MSVPKLAGSKQRWFAALAAAVGAFAASAPGIAQDDGGKWCGDVRIRFFVGGAEGDAFASIIQRGVEAAVKDTGANVEIVYSKWDPELMLSQLRDAIASQPDAIAMTGHAGDKAIMPLAQSASEAGILLSFHNVDVPEVRARFGGGYIGANLRAQGEALAEAAIEQLGLGDGDGAIVFGAFGRPGREVRDIGVAERLEDAGLEVQRIVVPPDIFRDPLQLTPQVTAAALRNPNLKLLVFSGGQLLGTVPQYMEAAGVAPGDIKVIGFDLNPAVLKSFESGHVAMTSDQQPFLQGYLPVISLCAQSVYKTSPLNVDTGSGLVDQSNYRGVSDLVKQGIR